jgi:hypothetical protein
VDETIIDKYERRIENEVLERTPPREMAFEEARKVAENISRISRNHRDQRQVNRLHEAENRMRSIQETVVNRGFANTTVAEERRLNGLIDRLRRNPNLSPQDRADLINQIRDFRRSAKQEENSAQRNLRDAARGNPRLRELQRNSREAIFHYVSNRAEELEQRAVGLRTVDQSQQQRSEQARLKYATFRQRERWCDREYDLDEDEDAYLNSLRNPHERAMFERRVTLHVAVMNKMRAAGLEDMANNKELGSLSQEDVRALYEHPGVRRAMELYVHLASQRVRLNRAGTRIANPRDRDKLGYTLLSAPSRTEIDVYRRYVEAELGRSGGLAPDQALDAEHTAYNMLLASNTFEAYDTEWKTVSIGRLGRRQVRTVGLQLKASTIGDLWSKAARIGMKPLDSLLEAATKEEAKQRPLGAFEAWAREQINASMNKSGVDKLDMVALIDSHDAKNYWKIVRVGHGRNQKTILFMPEVYPVQLMKSHWENTGVKVRGQDVTLNKFLEQGIEIPWKDVVFGGFDGVTLNAAHANEVWDLYQLGGGRMSGKPEAEWAQTVLGSLARFGWRLDEGKRRWLLYARNGVQREKRLPYINTYGVGKQIQREVLGEGKYGTYLDYHRFYFNWDRSYYGAGKSLPRRFWNYIKSWSPL